ncbi:HIT family protein [Methylocaldum marinum]|uniref:HIT family protein n=1 Tax=Methylocaldum marinum TaxID=1432792 RepID=UPI0015D1EE49
MSLKRIIAGDDLCIVIRDAYPVSAGHTLITARRRVGSFFETPVDERASLLQPW